MPSTAPDSSEASRALYPIVGSGGKMNERPADDTRGADDSVEAFAADLRALRDTASAPTLADLSQRAQLSRSVLSEAFAGRRLPTETTVRRLVPALGDESGPWLQRRASLDPRRAASAAPRTPSSTRTWFARPVSMATLLGAVATTAVIAVVATTAIWSSLDRAPETAPSPASTYLPVEDGVDPMLTECRADAVLAGGDEFLDGQVLVEMMYSNACMAVWGRVTRYDGQGAGNTISMRIYPRDDPESERGQSRSEADVQSLYTPLLIEPDVEARVCGVATISVNDEVFELTNPVCI